MITGAHGQDAYYLSKVIKRRKLGRVIGVHHRDTDATNELRFFDELIKVSITDYKNINAITNDYRPSYILNFAARSSSLSQFEDPLGLMKVNSSAVGNFLENIKNNDLNTTFIQASSSEIFAGGTEYPQSVHSPRVPRTFYGASKIFSDNLVKVYRDQFLLKCYSAIFYNHESPLRRNEFFTKKIVEQINNYKLGKQKKIKLYSPSAVRDWGYAGDYAKIIIEKILKGNTKDYLVGSGKLTTVKCFAEKLLRRFSLEYQDVVEEIETPPGRGRELVKLAPDSRYIDKLVKDNLSFDVDKLVTLLKRTNDKKFGTFSNKRL